MNENIRILAIDDEQDYVDVFNEYFSLRGYNITTSTDGVEGLQLVEKGNYDVVIVDLKIGKINGEDIVKFIKQSGGNEIVIVISAYTDGGVTQRRLLAEGVYGFFEKPISSLKDLEGMIKQAITKGNNND
jgi:CheY-like chemotaxis protein